jgi:hypothetical protein
LEHLEAVHFHPTLHQAYLDYKASRWFFIFFWKFFFEKGVTFFWAYH